MADLYEELAKRMDEQTRRLAQQTMASAERFARELEEQSQLFVREMFGLAAPAEQKEPLPPAPIKPAAG